MVMYKVITQNETYLDATVVNTPCYKDLVRRWAQIHIPEPTGKIGATPDSAAVLMIARRFSSTFHDQPADRDDTQAQVLFVDDKQGVNVSEIKGSIVNSPGIDPNQAFPGNTLTGKQLVAQLSIWKMTNKFDDKCWADGTTRGATAPTDYFAEGVIFGSPLIAGAFVDDKRPLFIELHIENMIQNGGSIAIKTVKLRKLEAGDWFSTGAIGTLVKSCIGSKGQPDWTIKSPFEAPSVAGGAPAPGPAPAPVKP